MYIYHLDSKDFLNLGPEKALGFIRRLLWLESTRTGIGRNLISIPSCINVGDGGLDAVVQNSDTSMSDVIPPGKSGYQIKSSDLPPANCKRELHEKGKLELPIKPEIARLLAENGTYVLILFADLTSQKQDERHMAIVNELAKFGYPHAESHVRLYVVTQLSSFADRYPSLVRWLKPEVGEGITHDEWSRNNDIKTPGSFVVDDERSTIISNLRTTLSNDNSESSIFRIVGLAGLGKTRLIFEALNNDLLKPRILYLNANIVKFSPLIQYLGTNEDIHTILVIDECSAVAHDDLVKTLAGLGPRISLITISHELGNISPPTRQFRLSKLSDAKMFEIIKQEIPGLPHVVIDRLVTFCGGYPKIAAILSEGFKSNPTQGFTFPSLTDTTLIDGLLYSGTKVAAPQVKKVLMGISLFDRVGYSADNIDEAKWLSDFIDVNWSDFRLVVREQIERGIMQGGYLISVTPLPLKIHLLNEWWNIYGDDQELINKLFREIPSKIRDNLISRFISNLGYASSVKSAKDLLYGILSEDGPFSDIKFLTSNSGSKTFLSLVESSPDIALERLRDTLGKMDNGQISELESYSLFPLVESLERIAIRREFFIPAVELLLKIAAADLKYNGEEIGKKFAELFLPVPLIGSLESSPSERFPILRDAIHSENTNIRRLSLKAFKNALEAMHFTIFRTDMGRDFHYIPNVWNYKNDQEIVEYYKMVWRFLSEEMEKAQNDIRDEIYNILIESARGMIVVGEELGYEVLSTFSRLSKLEWVNKSKLLDTILKIMRYERKRTSSELIGSFETLKSEIEGSGFHNKLKRYVENDFLDDYFQQDENKASEDWINARIHELCQEVVEKPSLLDSEYSWLSSDKAKRGYKFGRILGLTDDKFSLLPRLVLKHKQIRKDGLSTYFLGGYFNAIYETDVDKWEKEIETLSSDSVFKKYVPSLVYFSGMTDKAATIVLLLIKQGQADGNELFRYLYGGVINRISESVFINWLSFLVMNPSDDFVALGAEFIYFYYVFGGDKKLPLDLTKKLVLHPLFWNNPNGRADHMIPRHSWLEISKSFIKQYPKMLQEIANEIFVHFGEKNSVARDEDDIGWILYDAINEKPEEWTRKILDKMDPPVDEKGLKLCYWFGGVFTEKTPLAYILNINTLWDWIDEKKDIRAKHIARYIPSGLFHSNDAICLARELLAKYGEDTEVCNAFVQKYLTVSFSGSATNFYANKRLKLLEFRDKETDPNVLGCVSKCLEALDRQSDFFKDN